MLTVIGLVILLLIAAAAAQYFAPKPWGTVFALLLVGVAIYVLLAGVDNHSEAALLLGVGLDRLRRVSLR